MTLRFSTARYSYRGDDRLDVTLVGCARLITEGKKAPGSVWAPPGELLWPAKNHMDLADALHRRALTLPEASPHRGYIMRECERLTVACDTRYGQLYTSVLRVRFGRAREHYTPDDRLATSWLRVGNRRSEWDPLLASDRLTLVCMCTSRTPGPTQRWTCHRNTLANVLVRLGAIDEGEIDLGPVKSTPPAPVPPELYFPICGTRPPRIGSPSQRAEYDRLAADVPGFLGTLPKNTILVHGGAEGIDRTARDALAAAGLHHPWEIVPWYDAFGQDAAPKIRNLYNCIGDRGAAWPSSWSRGTLDGIAKARAAGVAIDVRDGARS